eukprot:12112787-Prorocentrum_lima.AAC.1
MRTSPRSPPTRLLHNPTSRTSSNTQSPSKTWLRIWLRPDLHMREDAVEWLLGSAKQMLRGHLGPGQSQ